ncbi:MAG: DCC1-like thiol-disulfide oxidoreductase family protein [Flavobacterium sp.]
MKRIRQFLRKAYDKQIDGTGLAVFRIAYSLVLLCEIVQMFYFRHLIFDRIPYLEEAEIEFAIPLGLWIISVLFILFGAFTRFFAILNYILGLIVIGTIDSFEYHVFYAYMGINFLLIFMPVSRCLSIDRLLSKLKYSNTTFQYNPGKNVSQLYYFIIPFIGLGLVYFDSVFFKLSSTMWMKGLGSWLPSSLPMITHANESWFLNQEYLVKGMGWITIVFETLFFAVFFRKKWRVPMLVIGLILHIGILVEFPIPWFALTACVIYLLMVPVSFWKRLFQTRNSKPTLFFYYDSECPLCIRTKLTISHFDWYNKVAFKTVQFDSQENEKLAGIDYDLLLDDIYSVDLKGNVYSGVDTYIQVLQRIFYLYPLSLILRLPGIYHLAKKVYSFIASNRNTERCTEENCGYNPPDLPDDSKIKILQGVTLGDLKYKVLVLFLAFITMTQIIFLSNTWLMKDFKKAVGFYDSAADKAISMGVSRYAKVTKTFFGITNHPVFSNEIHFNRYNHIIAVVYLDKNNKEHWLPIIDKNGQPDFYIYGANWVNWTFRVNQLDIKMKPLNMGIEKYTAFWAEKHGIDLNDAKFLIKVKKIESPHDWEANFLNKQIAKPWVDGGFVEWKNEEFISQVKEIEKI